MTAVLAQRPSATPAPPSNGGAPARRAVRRWAWRLLRREWRQQLLVLLLLTCAVAATIVGLGLVSNALGTDVATFGRANTRIDINNPDAQATADIAAAQKAFGTVEVIEHQSVPVPGSVTPVDLRAQDPHGVFSAPMMRLVTGRYPTGPGEVAMTAQVAKTFGVSIGSTWNANGRQLRVVGLVENPLNLLDDFALVAPGQVSRPATISMLVNASRSSVDAFRIPNADLSIMSDGTNLAQQRQSQALAVLLLATIGLTFVGLVAVAGFTVMAHRRLRALGMIAAIGATDRNVRGVMLANGAGVGAVSAVAGTVIGLASWFTLRPAFERIVGHRIDPMQLPWWAVIAAGVLAVLTALIAAWWPARAVARVPIISALSGRPARPQPAHRFAAAGVILAAAGFVLLALAHQRHPVAIVAGILATGAGTLLLAPLGIRAVALAGRRTPIAIRLAVRDLARYQARSGAALAAASLAVGIAATIAISAAASQAHDRVLTGGNLPANQLVVWIGNDPNLPGGGVGNGNGGAIVAVPGSGGGSGNSGPTQAQLAELQARVQELAASLGATADVTLSVPRAENAAASDIPLGLADANLVRPIHVARGQGWTFVAQPLVATPQLAALYHLPNSLLAGTDIVSSRTDMAGATLIYGKDATLKTPTIVQTDLLPNYSSAPNTLITQAGMNSYGLTPAPVGWLLQTPHPLTDAQITAARNVAASSGVSIETRHSNSNSLARLRNDATLAGMLVALGVLAMTVGLIRSETAADLRTLVATGASGPTRRLVTGATAGTLALLGSILGVGAAYLALIAWHWHDVSYLDNIPWIDLAGLLVGLPILATAGGWIFGRSPTSIARRPID